MQHPMHRQMVRRLIGFLIVLLAFIFSGCSTPRQSISAPPVSVPLQTREVVSATGEIRPAEWTTLSFEQPGQVTELLVEVGDEVEQGQIIARQDNTDLINQLNQVEIALKAARARLDKVQAPPAPEEVEAANQAVAAAWAQASAAVARRDLLYSSVSEAHIIEAEAGLKQAQDALANLEESMQILVDWVNTHNDPLAPVPGNPIGAWEPLSWQLELAQLEVNAAQSYLDDLLDGPHPDDLRVANAQIWLASSQAQAAEFRRDQLLAGPSEEQVNIANMEISQAIADIALVKARLQQVELIAPFDGVVTDVYIDIAAYIGPGQDIVQIADLSTLRVETTDLNEIDVALIHTGDPVTITFDALPDTLEGTVTRIAPKSSPGAGINYTVVIEFDTFPATLRWGMTAFVDIEVR